MSGLVAMRICHVTPHLPPDQAANALLPVHLGRWAREEGKDVEYVAHPPRSGKPHTAPGPVTWVAPLEKSRGPKRWLRLDSLAAAKRLQDALEPAIARADVVHVHSNGLLAELAGRVAGRHHKPTILTLYGTEIWHYRPRRLMPDLFTNVYRGAETVTFYSQGLLDRARELGLDRSNLSVVYPPVADEFTWHDETAQQAAKKALGIRRVHLLLNVKRLHPLAGQSYLIRAMPEVLAAHPDTQLVICGTGSLRNELNALVDRLGIGDHVTLAGLVDNGTVAKYCAAADAFVLPSLLEACPTVALEALAAGTPVISADHPGGVELGRLFGTDVIVVPRKDAAALGTAINGFLEAKRRTVPATKTTLDRVFRPPAVAARFREIYARAVEGNAAATNGKMPHVK